MVNRGLSLNPAKIIKASVFLYPNPVTKRLEKSNIKFKSIASGPRGGTFNINEGKKVIFSDTFIR